MSLRTFLMCYQVFIGGLYISAANTPSSENLTLGIVLEFEDSSYCLTSIPCSLIQMYGICFATLIWFLY